MDNKTIDSEIIINRTWAMPSGKTFSIKPISEFIDRLFPRKDIAETADPFANLNRIAKYCNDLDPECLCEFNLESLEFLKKFKRSSLDGVLFDPPYSPRQISECYKKFGLSVNMTTTQSSFWSKMKDEISRIVKPGGCVMSFGWNSQGMGKKRGFEIKEILLVPHGGAHNDTICVFEIKL